MSDIDPELVELGKTLEQHFQLHMKSSGGHTYGYIIIEKATGRVVAKKSEWTGNVKGKRDRRVVFTMGDDEFETAEAFLKAYRQRIRDEAFEAADPAKKVAAS